MFFKFWLFEFNINEYVYKDYIDKGIIVFIELIRLK